jgi:hypothetical protein
LLTHTTHKDLALLKILAKKVIRYSFKEKNIKFLLAFRRKEI